MTPLTLRVGESITLTCDITRSDTGAAWTVNSGRFWCYDPSPGPDVVDAGVVEAGSTTTSIVDASFISLAADAFIGLLFTLTHDGAEYETEVTDFATETGIFTVGALAVTPAVGDAFVLVGYPVISPAAATASTNTISYDVNPTNLVTIRPRTLTAVWEVTIGARVFREVQKLIIQANV